MSQVSLTLAVDEAVAVKLPAEVAAKVAETMAAAGTSVPMEGSPA